MNLWEPIGKPISIPISMSISMPIGMAIGIEEMNSLSHPWETKGSPKDRQRAREMEKLEVLGILRTANGVFIVVKSKMAY